ncbi:DUF1398 family protein, partial [Salmonella enterica subsp. enterica serovar Anatum]|nr:DUF1398 family protein [Salmonella enterica subsp. enterica serovar Anatum]
HFFERVRKDANFNAFLIDLEYNNIAYYIYFVATGNVKIITHASQQSPALARGPRTSQERIHYLLARFLTSAFSLKLEDLADEWFV